MAKKADDALTADAWRIIRRTTELVADSEKLSLFEAVTFEMNRRILAALESHPEGKALTKGLVGMIAYFSAIGYWRGYKDAKRHYAVLSASDRTPRGREEVRRAIERMLEKNLGMSAEEICNRLDLLDGQHVDTRRFSAAFDIMRGGKQKTLKVGASYGRPWRGMHKERCVTMMISRIRKRSKRERNARLWMQKAEKAFT